MLNYAFDASGNAISQVSGSVVLPQIKAEPSDAIGALGDIVAFSVVVADARALTFQWMFNGTPIPGATGDSLVLTNVGLGDEGPYSVVVTNSAGSVTSAPAALMLDTNGDGLPDTWQIANFGNLTGQRGAGDPDGDGVANLDEFFDATDPNDKGSFRPRLIAYSDPGGSVTVTPMKLRYDLGDNVTLTPTSVPPGVFVGWTGDLSDTSDPATLTMDHNKRVRARFAAVVALPAGLVASWRGEADARDSMGQHDGAFFAGPDPHPARVTASGKVGGAFDFDGTVHVRVEDSLALKPAQITVEAWVFPTLLGNAQAIVACGSSMNNEDTWYLGVVGSTPQFFSHGLRLLEGPSTVPLNAWTHLAISFDGTIKRLYFNGAQIAWRAESSALVYDPTDVPVTIGSDWINGKSGAGFTGRIDEVSLYNRALTADEVFSIYDADRIGKNFEQPYFTSTAQLPDAAVGTPYSHQCSTILGTAPIAFSHSTGLLPPGITLTEAGVVSGMPTTTGNFDFRVRVADAAGRANEQLCTLLVV